MMKNLILRQQPMRNIFWNMKMFLMKRLMQQRIKGYKRKENRSEEEEERRRKRFETEDGTITNTEIVNFVQNYLYYLFIYLG